MARHRFRRYVRALVREGFVGAEQLLHEQIVRDLRKYGVEPEQVGMALCGAHAREPGCETHVRRVDR